MIDRSEFLENFCPSCETVVNNNNSYKLLVRDGIINIDLVGGERNGREQLPGRPRPRFVARISSPVTLPPLLHSYVVNSFRVSTYVSRKLFSDCSVTNKPHDRTRGKR